MTDRIKVACATILLTDSYLPGAMVLAHSIRDQGTTTKLVCLVTPDTVSNSAIDDLKTIYDEILPVNRILNPSSVNFQLLDRPDLRSVFTKIHLWNLTQYSRIIYLDADTLALAPLNDLLSLELHDDAFLAAAPDIGWPDCFNSGVMVIRPDLSTYQRLLTLAEQGTSFDGADQGLLNEYFDGDGSIYRGSDGHAQPHCRSWKRLSFAYNCTPSAHYQYEPAFRHFRDDIKIVHFIGSGKPWQISRFGAYGNGNNSSAYAKLLSMWWAIYDRHYKPLPVSIPAGTLPQGHHNYTTEAFESHSHNHPSSQLDAYQHPYPVQDIRHPTAVSQEISQYPESMSSVPTHVYGEQHIRIPRMDRRLDPRLLPPWQGFERELKEKKYSEPDLNQSDSEDSQDISRRKATFQARASSRRYKSPPPPTRYVSSSSDDEDNENDHAQHDDYQQERSSTSHTVFNDKPRTGAADPPSHVKPVRQPAMSTWDPARGPPPSNSLPEAPNLNFVKYEMSMNTKLYQPPHEHHPSERGQHSAEGSQSHRQNHSHRQHQSSAASGARPQNVSSSATPHVPPPIFPWELHARAPSRVFSSETESVSSIAEDDFAPSTPGSSATSDIDGSLTPRAESGATLTKSWKSPFAPNVWDDVPAIQDHVSVIRQHKPTRVESSSADGNNDAAVTGHDEAVHPRFQRRASHAETGAVAGIRTPRLTAFRPSTSSSPRIRIGAASSSNFNNFTYSRLPYPSAEGVPSQNEWNPKERLDLLAEYPMKLLEAQTLAQSQARERETGADSSQAQLPPSPS